jgi:hypothetical protein
VIAYGEGIPCWVDLASSDVDGSAAFYSALLGWEAGDAAGPEAGGYRTFRLDGDQVAGLGPTQEGQPSHWNTYIAVDDAEAITDRVEAAGGDEVFGPLDVFDAGRMSVFQDPTGAFFSVWQAGRHQGAQRVNQPGALTMNELDTRDFDGAARFYGEVFGWEVDRIERDGRTVYGSWNLGGRLVAGLLPMGDTFPPQVPPHWRPYFGVDDLDGATARVRDLDGQVLTEPMSVPEGRFAAILDPQGAALSLWEGSYDPPPGS